MLGWQPSWLFLYPLAYITMLFSTPYLLASTTLQRIRRCLLTLTCVGALSSYAQAANYYWVGGTGRWNDLSHWATSSGGSTHPVQVPQSTDNVRFDVNSFTSGNETVTIGTTVTCLNMDWTGAVHASPSGNAVDGMRLTGSGTVEVNGDLRFAPGLGQQEVSFRMLAATGGHELDLQSVPVNGRLSFDNELGGWTFVSNANLVQYGATPGLIITAGSIDFGSVTISCYGVRSTGTRPRSLDLNNSTFNLLAPVNTWEMAGTNIILDAGTSTLRIGSTARSTANGYSFASTSQTYNVVEVAAGASVNLNVAGSTFKTLTINGNATLSTAATITGTLALGRDAVLRAASNQVLAFGPRATLTTSGDCAGLAQLQASVPGRTATLQRAGGWSTTALRYAAVQDIAFTGGGSLPATSSLDRGNNQGVTFTTLPITELYWVGGSGSWHDPSHWATSSGGSGAGNACLPTLATNVHFDANSFSATGQIVTLDGANAFCRDLDWTGANAPAFRTAASDVAQKQLGVGGSLTFNNTMTLNLGTTDLVFYGHESAQPSATVTTAGRTLTGNVYFRAPGSSYSLLDALTLAPSASSPNGRLYVEAGTFNTNSQAINAQGFTSGYAATASVFTTGTGGGGPLSGATVAVNLGSSIITLTPASATSDVGTRITYTWDIATGTVLSAGSSTIRIGSSSTHNQAAYFRAGLGYTYNIVSFTDPAALSLPTLVSGGGAASTIGQLNFAGTANINASNNITQQLLLTAGNSYNFNNTTQSFAANAQVNAVGGCPGLVYISGSSAAARATFSKPAGGTQANQPLQYASLRNIAFIGSASWEATRSIDNGGTSGIAYTQRLVPRTLYWVGGTGRWSELAHWALSSGGAGGNCIPNQLDNVIFDAQSFTATGQIVTQDAIQASCASMSWTGVTYTPTFGEIVTNKLNIYGSLTWSTGMKQQLLGETLLLGAGTLTSAGQLFSGGLTIDVPDAAVTLADAIRQPRNSGSGLTLAAGTLLTNDQTVQVRSFTSVPTAGDPARVLSLGASQVEITAGAWNISQPSSLLFDAGTSRILLSTGTGFSGNGFSYNIVETGSGVAHTVSGNSTIGTLLLGGDNTVTGNNTITTQLHLEPGSTFLFGAGTTTMFTAEANVHVIGTGTDVITLQSTVSGQAFTWSKPASSGPNGTVCASYIYLRDSQAQGGAYFEAGQQANNQGNTSGWSFASLPQVTYHSQQVCPQAGPHPLHLTFAGFDRFTQTETPLAAAQFPLTVVLKNLTTGTVETLSVPSATYDYIVPTSGSAAQYQVLQVATNDASCGPLINAGTFPVVADSPYNGPAGQWTGAGTTSDWQDCQNWASGTVPTASTDVTVGPSNTMPVLNDAGANAGTLHVLSGGQLTLGSSAELTVTGDWLSDGTIDLDPQSQVTFAGTTLQQITGAAFGRVVVNNAAGIALQADASSATSLTLTAGTISTGTNKWLHTNPAAGSLTGGSTSSYVAGTLRRAIASGTTASYAFPVGSANQYAQLDLLSNKLVGTSYLEASFGPKVDSDLGLDCSDTTPAMRYLAVHAAGLWTLTPDAQPTGGSYAVRAYLAPFSNLLDNEFAVLKRPDGSTSAADWSTGGGTLNDTDGEGRRVSDGYALRSDLHSFSQFAVGLTYIPKPLPVTLLSFRAAARGTTALLTWATAEEQGITAYEVERSADGYTFQRLGRVTPKVGTSNQYTYVDTNVPQVGPTQVLYYRLHIIEPQTASYSPVATLRFTDPAATLAVWPTVFSTNLTVDGSGLGEDLLRIDLLDARGQLVQSLVPTSHTTSTVLRTPSLPAGLYIVRGVTRTKFYQQRVMHE